MRRVLAGIAAVSVAAVLAGCSGGDDATEDSPTQSAGAEATSEDTGGEEEAIDLNDPMTFEEARDKALEVRDGRITEWSYSWDDNRLEYQFDIEQNGDSEEVTVDADTGEVTED